MNDLVIEKPDKDQGGPGNNSQPPADSQGQPPTHGTIDKAGATPEEKHRADEKDHWRVQKYTGILSALLTAGALGGALASAIISNQALRVSQLGTRAALTAATQATRQADYAEEQLKLSKSNQLFNDTPNIQISFEPLAQNELSAGKIVEMQVHQKNGGPGIAQHLINHSRILVISGGVKSNSDLPKMDLSDSGEEGITIVSTTNAEFAFLTKMETPITEDQAKDLCETCGSKLVVYGTIKFDDLTGTHYEKEFCGFAGSIIKPSPGQYVISPYRLVQYCSVHNAQRRLDK